VKQLLVGEECGFKALAAEVLHLHALEVLPNPLVRIEKLSENPYERANRPSIRRLIAT
jgi:hypothetical protein